MVGLGMLMLGFAVFGLWLFRQGKLDTTPLFLRLGVLMMPAGFIAVIAGWFTAEIGRQPYTVYGLLRTVDSVSPVTADGVGMSLIVFVFTYGIVFFSGIYYISRLVLAGPSETAESLKDMESKLALSDRIEFSGFEFASIESDPSTDSEDKT